MMILTIVLAVLLGTSAAGQVQEAPVLNIASDQLREVEEWHFVKVFDFGDEVGEPLFADIRRVLRSDQGYIILEAYHKEVVVLDPSSGKHHSVSVGGSGPGECQTPADLIIWPDQYHVALLDQNPPFRLVANADLCPGQGSCEFGCPRRLRFAEYSDNTSLPSAWHLLYNLEADVFVADILETRMEAGNQVGVRSTILYDRQGKKISTICERSRIHGDRTAAHDVWWRFPDKKSLNSKRLFITPGEDYTVHAYLPNGELEFTLCNESYSRRYKTYNEQAIFEGSSDSDYAPDIKSLHCVGNRLLVLNSQQEQADELSFDSYTFDEKEGVNVSTITLPGIEVGVRCYWIDENNLAVAYVSDEFYYITFFEREER